MPRNLSDCKCLPGHQLCVRVEAGSEDGAGLGQYTVFLRIVACIDNFATSP